jgi:hypothetical protein
LNHAIRGQVRAEDASVTGKVTKALAVRTIVASLVFAFCQASAAADAIKTCSRFS